MIQAVYGIKDFQTNLPKISREIKKMGGHYLVTNRSQPAFVTIPFDDYQKVEDVLLELSSPILQKDIKTGRNEYKTGKTKAFTDFVNKLNQ